MTIDRTTKYLVITLLRVGANKLVHLNGFVSKS